jgi:tetratricopeptide (TPR) repeat protein
MGNQLTQNFHYGIDNLKAFYYSLTAGEAARKIFDTEEALKYYSWADELLEELIDAGQKPIECDPNWIGDFRLTYGDLLMHLGKNDKAQQQFELGLELSRQNSLSALEGNLLRAMGEICWNRTNYKDALTYCQSALKILEPADDNSGLARLYSLMGNIYFSQIFFDTAIDYYNKSLEFAIKSGSRSCEGEALRNIGSIYGRQGQFEKSLNYLGKSLVIARDLSDRDSERQITMLMGNVHLYQGDLGQALSYYYHSRALARAIGKKRGECRVTLNMGEVCRLQQDLKSAKNYFKKAHSIAVKIQDREIEGHAISNLGLAYQGLDDPVKALECFEKALAIFKETNYRSDAESETLHGIARIMLGQGNMTEAKDYYERATASSRDNNLWKIIVSSLRGLSASEQALGQPDVAKQRLVEAMTEIDTRLAANPSDADFQLLNQLKVEVAQEVAAL